MQLSTRKLGNASVFVQDVFLQFSERQLHYVVSVLSEHDRNRHTLARVPYRCQDARGSCEYSELLTYSILSRAVLSATSREDNCSSSFFGQSVSYAIVCGEDRQVRIRELRLFGTKNETRWFDFPMHSVGPEGGACRDPSPPRCDYDTIRQAFLVTWLEMVRVRPKDASFLSTATQRLSDKAGLAEVKSRLTDLLSKTYSLTRSEVDRRYAQDDSEDDYYSDSDESEYTAETRNTIDRTQRLGSSHLAQPFFQSRLDLEI